MEHCPGNLLLAASNPEYYTGLGRPPLGLPRSLLVSSTPSQSLAAQQETRSSGCQGQSQAEGKG